MPEKIITDSINQEYKYGFVTQIEQDKIPPGLNEDVVRLISQKKNENPSVDRYMQHTCSLYYTFKPKV